MDWSRYHMPTNQINISRYGYFERVFKALQFIALVPYIVVNFYKHIFKQKSVCKTGMQDIAFLVIVLVWTYIYILLPRFSVYFAPQIACG